MKRATILDKFGSFLIMFGKFELSWNPTAWKNMLAVIVVNPEFIKVI